MNGFTNWICTLGTTGASVQTANTTEQSARSGRNSANTTTLNNLKATLKTERETKEAAADRLYRNTEQNSWNNYLTSVRSANTVYLGSIKTAENTYKTAVDTADTAYRAASVTAYVDYQNTTRDLSVLYSTAVAHAGDTSFNLASYFTTTGGNTACQAYEFTTRKNAEENNMIGSSSPPLLSPETETVVNLGFEQAWKSMSRNKPSEISTGVLEKTVSPLQDVNISDSLFSSTVPLSSWDYDLEAVASAIQNHTSLFQQLPSSETVHLDSWRTLTSEEKEFLRFVFGAVTKKVLLIDDTMIVKALDNVILWNFGEIDRSDHPVKYRLAKMALGSSDVVAVTLGRDIYFAPGCYPQPSQNIRLIGHEMMHVLQVDVSRVGYGIWGGMYLADSVVATLTTKGGIYDGNTNEILAYALDETIDEILNKGILKVGEEMPTGNKAAEIQKLILRIFIDKWDQREDDYGCPWWKWTSIFRID